MLVYNNTPTHAATNPNESTKYPKTIFPIAKHTAKNILNTPKI